MAVQLIDCNSDGKLFLTPAGMTFLRAIGNNACHVTGVIGVERKGKSTILSMFSGANFPSRAGNKGYTKAVMASFSKDNLWLDFEGFAQDTRHNTRLLIAAVMMSNVIIYNTEAQITVDALDKLRAAGSLAAQIGSSGDKPALLYLLRDYNLDDNIDQIHYLEETMDNNPELAKSIRALFPIRRCVGIAHPGMAFLNNPSGGYTPEVKKTIVYAENALKEIRSYGKKINGLGLIALITAVCDAINSSDHDIGTAWQTRVKAEKMVARMQQELRLTTFLHKLQGCGPRRWQELVDKQVPEAERGEFLELLHEARTENEQAWRAACLRCEQKLLAQVGQSPGPAELSAAIDSVLKVEEDEVLETVARPLFATVKEKLELLATAWAAQLTTVTKLEEQVADVKRKRDEHEAAKFADLELRLALKQREVTELMEHQEKAAQAEVNLKEKIVAAHALALLEARADFEAKLEHSAQALKAEECSKRDVEALLDAASKAHAAAQAAAKEQFADMKNLLAECEYKLELKTAEHAQAVSSLRECEADKSAVKRECDRLRAQLQQSSKEQDGLFELGALRAKIERLEATIVSEREESLKYRKRPRGFIEDTGLLAGAKRHAGQDFTY